MVIQARKNPDDGSEDLQTFSWTIMSLGGLIGALAAAFLTENYEPRYCFLMSAVISLLVAIAAVRLNIQMEFEGIEVQSNA